MAVTSIYFMKILLISFFLLAMATEFDSEKKCYDIKVNRTSSHVWM